MTNKVNIYLIGIAFLNPLLAYISLNLLIASILIEFIVLFIQKDNKILNLWKIFILSSMYFGISILEMKLYDIVLILICLYSLLVLYKCNIKLNKGLFIKHLGIYLLFLYLTCILLYTQSDSAGIMEYLRYILSFMIVIVFAYSNFSIEQIKKLILFTPIIALKNIISGLIIYLLSTVKGSSLSFSTELISFQNHYSEGEIRLVGFYSDPNKYYLYFIVVYLLLEIYKKALGTKMDHEKMYKVLLIIGMISSLSRTAILIVIILIFFELLNKLISNRFRNIKILYYSFLSLLFFFNMDTLKYYFNKIVLNNLTILMGRESALIYSPSLEQDSRILASKIAIRSIEQNPIFGNGFYTWSDLYYMPPHNTFLIILQDIGVLGLLLYLISVFGILKFLKIEVIFALLVLPSITLDLQNFRMLYFVLAVSLFFQYNKNSENEDRKYKLKK